MITSNLYADVGNITLPYTTTSTWVMTNANSYILQPFQVVPQKETNLQWLNRRVKEICDCWKS